MGKFNDYNFSGKKALVRVDFNVPLNEDFKITDDTRMTATIPTIKKILDDGGSVIIISHLGRPKNGPESKFSLKHLLPHLHELLGARRKIFFANNCVGSNASLTADMLHDGEILVLDNLRFHKEEEAGDKEFAGKLAALADVYVNDAFGTAHRAHASTSIVAEFFKPENRMFGLLMEAEVENAQKVIEDAKKPFTAIIGGAKVSDKILLIENLLDKATDIIIGGGMAYTFIKAKGGDIGNSLCEDDRLDISKEILEKAKSKGVNIHLPEDSIIADKFSEDAKTEEKDSAEIPGGWMGLDIGPKAIEQFTEVVQNSKTILWNGPMGVFEMSAFKKGTRGIAEAVAAATKKGAYSLIGGGDSVAAINKFNLAADVSFVSTGGGALLEYFEGKELPGIKAITENQ